MVDVFGKCVQCEQIDTRINEQAQYFEEQIARLVRQADEFHGGSDFDIASCQVVVTGWKAIVILITTRAR